MASRLSMVPALLLVSAACASRPGVETSVAADPAESPTPRVFAAPAIGPRNSLVPVAAPSECYWAVGGQRAYCDRPANRNIQGRGARSDFRPIQVSFEIEGSGYVLVGAVVDGRLHVLYPASPDSIGWVGSRRLTRVQAVMPTDTREYPVFFLLTSKGPLNFGILSDNDQFVELQIDRDTREMRSHVSYSRYKEQREQQLKDYAPMIRDIAEQITVGRYAVWSAGRREKWLAK